MKSPCLLIGVILLVIFLPNNTQGDQKTYKKEELLDFLYKSKEIDYMKKHAPNRGYGYNWADKEKMGNKATAILTEFKKEKFAGISKEIDYLFGYLDRIAHGKFATLDSINKYYFLFNENLKIQECYYNFENFEEELHKLIVRFFEF